MKMNKKGQAAMEFLMTYGWAILVVIAAIAALAYFGVLSPDKMLPERTTFQAPVPSVDNAVVKAGPANSGSVEIALKNNVGFPINISGVSVPTTGTCAGVTANTANVTVGASTLTLSAAGVSKEVLNGEGFRVAFTCSAGLTAGQKFNSDVTITYKNTESGLTKPHLGTVSARIA